MRYLNIYNIYITHKCAVSFVYISSQVKKKSIIIVNENIILNISYSKCKFFGLIYIHVGLDWKLRLTLLTIVTFYIAEAQISWKISNKIRTIWSWNEFVHNDSQLAPLRWRIIHAHMHRTCTIIITLPQIKRSRKTEHTRTPEGVIVNFQLLKIYWFSAIKIYIAVKNNIRTFYASNC